MNKQEYKEKYTIEENKSNGDVININYNLKKS